MNLTKATDIAQIQLSDMAIIRFSAAWSSQNEEHRIFIKNQIDLNPFEFYSISHCPLVGGILFSRSPCGLDFEVTSRVKDKIIRRVSSAAEIQHILDQKISAAKLWTAKESSWKSLRGFHQPQTISSMKIQFQDLGEFVDERKDLLNSISFQAQVQDASEILKSRNPDTEGSANFQQAPGVLITGFCWEIPFAVDKDSVSASVCFR